MPLVRAMRMINAIEAGAVDGPALDVLLSDTGRLAELNQTLVLNGQTRRMMSSQSTMHVLAHSDRAMEALIQSPIALFRAANSPIALSEIIGSTDAIRALFSSDAARRLLRESNVAFEAITNAVDTAQVPWIACPAGIDPANYTTLPALLADNSAWEALKNTPESIIALFEYAASTQALINNSARLAEVVSSQSMMDILRSQPVGMAVFSGSVSAKMAMFGSDVALTAIAGSSSAMDILRAASSYTRFATDSVIGTRAFGADPAGSYIVIGVSIGVSAVGKLISVETPKAGTTRPKSLSASSGVYSSSAASGTLMCPVKGPFSVTTDYASAAVLYVGALRCDQ